MYLFVDVCRVSVSKVGLALGVVMLITVPAIVIFKFDALRELIIALENLQ